MSEGMNKVILLGNLGADPELRFTGSGQAVLNMRLATTESWFDKEANERKEKTEWHSVVVWGKRGEGLAKILNKGSSILVEGGLRTSKYQDRDGNDRYKTEVHATDVYLTGGKRDSNGATSQPSAPRPATQQRPAQPQRSAPVDNPIGDVDDYGGGDELPY